MRRRIPAAQLLLSLLAASLTGIRARAASEIGHPVTRVFTPRIYGADAQNRAGVQDAAGVMYFANSNGILSYDGAEWRVIRTGYSESINGLARDDRDTLYVAGTHQIGYLPPDEAGRRFVSLADRLPPGSKDDSIFYHVIALGDAVYFSTERAILIWREGRFDLLPVPNPAGGPLDLYRAGDDVFVCAGRGPLRRVRGARLETVSADPFFAGHAIRLLAREPDGAYLVVTAEDGLFRWRDGRFTPAPTEADSELRAAGVYRAQRLADGSFALMLAHQRGTLFLSREGRFLWRVDESLGLPSSVVFDVASDREGGLWLCLASGLARLEWPAPFSLFDRTEGLPGHAWSIARADGRFYFGTDEGLYRQVPGSAQTGNARFELVLKGRPMALLPDPGGLLAAVYEVGIVQLGAGTPRTVFRPAKPVYALLRDRRDALRIWLGGIDDLRSIRRAGDRWRDEGPVAGLPTGTRTLVQTADGALWTASMTDGLYRIRFGAPSEADPRGRPEVTHFAVGTHGLPAHPNTMRVYDWGGRVLGAMGGEGYWLLDPSTDSFAPLERSVPNLPEPKGLSLFLNASEPDQLWVQRDTNLPRDLAVFQVSRNGATRPLPHTFADAAHFARVLFVEPGPNGPLLWIGGNDGLLRVETARAFGPAASVRLALRSTNVPPNGKLDAEHPTVSLEAIAPMFRSGGGAEYQSRLIGFERDWSDWSYDRKRVFTHLRPGSYRFEARARDQDGLMSGVVTRSFVVLPPWWQTWWAIAVMSAAGIAVVAGFTRWLANRALKRRVALLEARSAVERERLRLARDLHDEVGSGLGRVILFAGEADRSIGDPEALRAALRRVRESAQDLVQHAREIVWAVSPQNDALAEVVERLGDYAEETLRSAGIVCTLEAPPPGSIPAVALGSDARHNLFLAVKEAVHNCVKYSAAQRADFRVGIERDELQIVLRDHGRGFAPGDRRGTGHGLRNILARAEAIGGRAEVRGVPGEGVTVTVRMPLPKEVPV